MDDRLLDELPDVVCEHCGLQHGALRDQDCESCAHLDQARDDADRLFTTLIHRARGAA